MSSLTLTLTPHRIPFHLQLFSLQIPVHAPRCWTRTHIDLRARHHCQPWPGLRLPGLRHRWTWRLRLCDGGPHHSPCQLCFFKISDLFSSSKKLSKNPLYNCQASQPLPLWCCLKSSPSTSLPIPREWHPFGLWPRLLLPPSMLYSVGPSHLLTLSTQALGLNARFSGTMPLDLIKPDFPTDRSEMAFMVKNENVVVWRDKK